MTRPAVFIEGVDLWAPGLPGWQWAEPALDEKGAPQLPDGRRPAAELLPPAERRRAPDTVALALEVASAALKRSAREPGTVLSVFTSAHGDLQITDYMCRTLASAPLLLSPTRFHNSIHNAPSGYWGIATGSMIASTSVSGFDCSFAAGLLESLIQCAADGRAVLLVGCDIAACGPLCSTNDSRGQLAVAVVVAPERTENSKFELSWALESGNKPRARCRSAAARDLCTNAMSDALPFFEAVARRDCQELSMPLNSSLALNLQWRICA